LHICLDWHSRIVFMVYGSCEGKEMLALFVQYVEETV